jgi:threonylcarbamoyladenosine tRNA methylthiotransferase MtaB
MKVYLKTFGCRANQYDSETVRAMVERGGGEIVDRPELADMAVFNSCAVTAEAEVDLRKSVRRAARARPDLRTVVMGCAAARDRGELGRLPSVARVVPAADFTQLAEALALPEEPIAPARGQHGTRALLRIQDGCDEHCTFCATTQARGANRSRPVETLVEEAAALSERHAEIVLTGVHIGTYGREIGSSLGVLVERLVTTVRGARFRLSSVEATEIDPALADLLRAGERVTPHVHAPLQSGSDAVLKRMGRHWYSAATYAAAVERVLRDRPVFALGADVIAGFPGETDADHAQTIALLASLPLTYLHVFPFSLRPGTAAARLAGHLPATVVSRRAAELRAVGAEKARGYRERRRGGLAEVVVLDRLVGRDTREGLTEDYLSVQIPSGVGRGVILTATLRGTADRLIAEPVPPTPHASS